MCGCAARARSGESSPTRTPGCGRQVVETSGRKPTAKFPANHPPKASSCPQTPPRVSRNTLRRCSEPLTHSSRAANQRRTQEFSPEAPIRTHGAMGSEKCGLGSNDSALKLFCLRPDHISQVHRFNPKIENRPQKLRGGCNEFQN